MKKIIVYAFLVLSLSFLSITSVFAADSSNITETIFFGNVEDDGGGCGIFTVLSLVIDIISIGIGILAIIGITIAGIQYLTASGKEEQVKKSKTRIFQIVIGLVVYAAMYAGFNWLLPGGKLNTSPCATVSDQELAKIKAEEEAKEQASLKPGESSSPKQETSNANVNEKTADGEPACSLRYDNTTGELTFKRTKNATKYAIAKKGKSPSYEKKPVIYHPGQDRIAKGSAKTVSLSYVGYVKNSKNKVGTCSTTIKVTRGIAAVEYAKTFLGKPYCHYWVKARKKWYGQPNLTCTDCSGFTGGIYSYLLGEKLSRKDDDQCRGAGGLSTKVSLKEAKAGDILCYGSPNDYSHVAFYLGKTNKNGYPYSIQMGGGKGKVWTGVYKKKYHHIVRIRGTN